MNEKDIQGLLQTARERLEDARILFEKQRYQGTAERAYFAIFHAASAMLLHVGISAKTHDGVKIKFGELFVRSGKVERRFGKILSKAYDLRVDTEYVRTAGIAITREVAEEQLQRASEFLDMAERYIRQPGGKLEPA
jgi:uncharacterized protein